MATVSPANSPSSRGDLTSFFWPIKDSRAFKRILIHGFMRLPASSKIICRFDVLKGHEGCLLVTKIEYLRNFVSKSSISHLSAPNHQSVIFFLDLISTGHNPNTCSEMAPLPSHGRWQWHTTLAWSTFQLSFGPWLMRIYPDGHFSSIASFTCGEL